MLSTTIILLAAVAVVQCDLSQCQRETAVAFGAFLGSAKSCNKENIPCKFQCVYKRQGMTSDGVLTAASFASGSEGRCSGILCGRLSTMATKCLTPFGGAVNSESKCSDWQEVAKCMLTAVEQLCNGHGAADRHSKRPHISRTFRHRRSI